MTLVKTLIKTIVIKADGVYVSSMEEPKEPTNYKNYPLAEGEDEKYWNQISKEEQYEEAISAFTSSLIKVENPAALKESIWKYGEIALEGTYPAPDGLVMDIEFMPLYCMDGKECICDSEDVKRDECPHKVAIVSFLPDKEEEKELIVELVENCSLVREGSQENGHDCWGNLEWTSYKYVYLNDKEQRCWDGCYIVHDGKEVKEFIIPALFWIIQNRIQYQEKVTGFNYGWTPSTEKDYNNPKSGVEYRMILVSPPQEKPEKEQTKLWQCCPKCGGSGMAMNFKNLIPTIMDTCDVCNGTKIISTLTGLPPNPPKASTTPLGA